MIGCYMMTDIRGLTFCLIHCVLKMTSTSGEELTNEFDCPLMELKDKLKTVFFSRIYCIINIVHECTETYIFRESTELQTIEKEQNARSALIYDHNNSKKIYSLNIYAMKKK